LGGERVWFRCRAKGCGRRLALLYGGKVFAWRHCHQLAYPSQREQPFECYQRRGEKSMGRLGWASGEDRYLLGKPKGRHRRTCHRLFADLDQLEAASEAGLLDDISARFA
jgi:hypothetical protein